MATSIANTARVCQPVLPDTAKGHMAKADARKPDTAWNAMIGAAIQRAILAVWETNQLAAHEIGVDDAEFGKWMSGARRAQMDKLFAVERLRQPLMAELSKLAGATVRLQIEWERTA